MSLTDDVVMHNVSDSKEGKNSETEMSFKEDIGATRESEAQSASSAPSSPCVSRKASSALNIDSKIPRPSTLLASPVPLRRSGSLRVRGDKSGFTHPKSSPGRTHYLTPRTSPGTAFPSITEASESWKKSLRGAGDGLSYSNLRQQRHHRSLQSLSSRGTSKDLYPHTPTPSPEDLEHIKPQNLNRFLLDHSKEFSHDQDDLDSLRSYGSNCSTQSACDHAQFARNGTTFSGRRMKYIVHCSSHPEPDDYLTPTQRANQQIRRLKALVEQARKDLEMKDESIFRLTKEVVELKLLRDENDGSPIKISRNSEDSPVCRVVSQLESEYGNSTSLSDSGHFDDILSSTSVQLNHSPGRRQLMPTPESDQIPEIYQRRIDEVTRKLSEKNSEDRKSLVDMYEKKMEDMSRRYSEKYQKEKKDLIEMFERKIADQQSKEIINQDRISPKEKSHENAGRTCSDVSINSMQKKIDETQHLLEINQEKVTSLTQQLDDANMRCNDLQQELFQCRESVVTVDEEVENLQTTVALQAQQLADKRLNFVQNAQLESELELLRRYVEEHKDTSEAKSYLEKELARTLHLLEEQKQYSKAQEVKLIEVETFLKEECKKNSDVKSQLEGELEKALNKLKQEEQKCSELERLKRETKMIHEEECKQAFELKSQLEDEIENLTNRLKTVEEEINKLLQESAVKDGKLKQALDLNTQLQVELASVKNLLLNKEEKCRNLEQIIQTTSAREKEFSETSQIILQLQNELTDVKCRLNEEELKTREVENWKIKVQNMEEEMAKHIQQAKNLKEQSGNLEVKVNELEASLAMENDKNQKMVAQITRLKHLEKDCEELEGVAAERLNQMQELSKCNATFQEEIQRLTVLSDQNMQECKETNLWKEKCDELQEEKKCLEENLVEMSQKLQHLLLIESEVAKLHTIEKQNNAELEVLEHKIKDLEEECKFLKQDNNEKNVQIQHLQDLVADFEENSHHQPGGELSEELNHFETKSELSSQYCGTLDKSELKQDKSEIVKRNTCSPDAEVQRLKELLDQSYWVQSENESLKMDLERKVAQLMLQLEKQAAENLNLSQQILEMQRENEELIAFKEHCLHPELKRLSEDGIYAECDQQREDNPQKELVGISVQKEPVEPFEGGESIHTAYEVIPQLRSEVEGLRKALVDQEKRHSEINLKMYLKGQEAAKFEHKDKVLEIAAHAPEKVSVPELLSQLAETEKELEKIKAMYRQLAEGQANSRNSPEATLLFLKSAVYYFLTDEANCQGHLHAIQSILGFTESEKQAIDTLTYIRR